MKSIALTTIMILGFSGQVFSQVLPVPDKNVPRVLPNDEEIEIDSEYKRLYEGNMRDTEGVRSENRELRKQLDLMKRFKEENAARSNSSAPFPKSVKETEPPPKVTKPAPARSYGSGIQVFGVSEESELKTVLPAGSWVRGTLLTGGDANKMYPYNALIQLDYAFTGPNGYKIPLQGCLMVADMIADLSVEKIMYSPHTISCVRSNNEYVERSVSGWVTDGKSENGIEGVYSSKRGKKFLAATLAATANGAAGLFKAAQWEETAVGGEAGGVARNFKGDVGTTALVAGLGEGAKLVAEDYLAEAKALLPTIKIGSGENLFIVLKQSVTIPGLDNAANGGSN